MFRRACLLGAVAVVSACQPLEGLLKLKPDLPRTAASAAVDLAGSPVPDASPSLAPVEAATPTPAGSTATPAPSAAPTATPTPFLDFLPVPQASPAAGAAPPTPTPKPTAKPTATPTPSQPQTCTRTRQVTSTGGPQHGRFNGAILPREWASVYANEDEILLGIDNIYQTDWACFQAFYPDATAVYKRLRGRS